MTTIQPVVMLPDDNARAYAESSAPARTEGTSPALHATEEMRRLATPWSVAVAKANLLRSCDLPPGIILDPACGSGTQLAALCSTLGRPGLGVELSGAVAPLAAVNLERCGKTSEEDWSASSRILWGDGTAAQSILKAYHQHIEQNPSVALLHVDPARPNDAQQHTLEEMQPRLDELLKSWAPHLGSNPAVILDVSPRLLDTQRQEIESIVTSIWSDVAMTWQWLTQGRGRIDRLSLWLGAAAGSSPSRLIRLTKSGEIQLIEGTPAISVAQPSGVNTGDGLAIVDPCVISSGLGESWKKMWAGDESRWETISGRRPICINPTGGENTVREATSTDSTIAMIESMIQASGEVISMIPNLNEETISDFAKVASDAGISSLKLRCTLDPDVQPKLQSKIDREMKNLDSKNMTKSGFVAEINGSYLICKEQD